MPRFPLIKACVMLIAAAISLMVWARPALGQDKCLTDDEVKGMLARLDSSQEAVAPSNQLKDELLKLKADNQKLFQNIVASNYKDDTPLKQWKEARANNTVRLCQVLKE